MGKTYLILNHPNFLTELATGQLTLNELSEADLVLFYFESGNPFREGGIGDHWLGNCQRDRDDDLDDPESEEAKQWEGGMDPLAAQEAIERLYTTALSEHRAVHSRPPLTFKRETLNILLRVHGIPEIKPSGGCTHFLNIPGIKEQLTHREDVIII